MQFNRFHMKSCSSIRNGSIPRKSLRSCKCCSLIIILIILSSIAISFIYTSLEYRLQLLKLSEIQHIDCSRIFDGDIHYAKSLKRQQLIPSREDSMDMSCDGIRYRILSRYNPTTGFPIAYIKVVNEGYEFLEEQLAVTYSIENTYCFALDVKSTYDFRRKFNALSSCLPNVFLSMREYNTDSTGRHQTNAQYDCLQVIRDQIWNYVIFLQNYDIIIKTNSEITQILKAMDGANDIEMTECPLYQKYHMSQRNLGKLGLCPKNLSQEDNEKCRKEEISMAKGSTQATITRTTAVYLLDTINTTILRKELNELPYGMDELFIQSIISTQALKIPGMYPSRCLHNNNSPSHHLFMTRLAHWSWWKDYDCGTGIWRNNVCVFGMEDLPYISGVHHIMVNKMLPDKDYGAISCFGELLFNRTHFYIDNHRLIMSIYENLPMVQLRKGMRHDPTYFDRWKCPPMMKLNPLLQLMKDAIYRIVD